MTPVAIQQLSELEDVLQALAKAAGAVVGGARLFGKNGGGIGLSRIKVFLDERPELFQQLSRGEAVLLSDSDRLALAKATGDGVDRVEASPALLLPVTHRTRIEAVLCLMLSPRNTELSARELAALRDLGLQTAPHVARLREVEALRAENQALRQRAARAAEMERAAAELKLVVLRGRNRVHDLGGMLQMLSGCAGSARSGSAEGLSDDHLRAIQENTAKLFRAIKDFWRLENLPFQTEWFDLRAVCRQAIDAVRPLTQEKSIRLAERIPADEFPVLGDRRKLAKVFEDLLLNAAKFAESGGEIVLELSRDAQIEETRVTISDTGVGIPPEVLEKVFDRYYADESAQGGPGDDGRGAGFNMIQDIVRQHGGKISVTSKVGQGSTFVIVLPMIQGSDTGGRVAG